VNDDVLRAALAAQKASISSWILRRYIDGSREIEVWGDDFYRWAKFGALSVAAELGCGRESAMHKLNKLARDGAIERIQLSGAVRFRFPRDVCDRLAAEATAEWQAAGFVIGDSRTEHQATLSVAPAKETAEAQREEWVVRGSFVGLWAAGRAMTVCHIGGDDDQT